MDTAKANLSPYSSSLVAQKWLWLNAGIKGDLNFPLTVYDEHFSIYIFIKDEVFCPPVHRGLKL